MAPDSAANTIITRTEAETTELGRRLGAVLPRGSIVALRGELGAGKTALVKGMALALGVEEPVTSPTFTLVSVYAGRRGEVELPLYHIDLYRITSPRQLEDLGLEEMLYGDGISAVEWPEHAGDLIPEDAVRVTIEFQSHGSRRFTLQGITL